MGIDDREEYILDLFPELLEIKDPGIRQKVIDCWLCALQESQWDNIEAMPWIPGKAEFITNVQHVRGTAQIGMMIVKTVTSSEGVSPGIAIDLDVVIAGCLLHDVGKLLEYTGPTNNTGNLTPMGRHMMHHILGVYLAMKVGLNAEIVHCIEAHRESESFPRSLEAQIVHWADLCHASAMVRLHPEVNL